MSNTFQIGAGMEPGLAVAAPPEQQRAHQHFARLAAAQDRRAPRWLREYRLTVIIGDFVVAALAAVLALTIHFPGAVPPVKWLAVGVLLPLAWVAALAQAKAYTGRFLGLAPEEYRAVLRAGGYLFFSIAMASFVGKLELSRLLVLSLVPLTVLLCLGMRYLQRRRLMRARRQGLHLQPTIVVGRGVAVAEIIQEIRDNPVATGLEVIAACVSDLGDLADVSGDVCGVPIYGPPEMALLAVDELGAEAAIVASHPHFAGHGLRRLSWALAERKVELLVAPGIAEVAAPRLSLHPRAGLSLLHVERPIMSGGKLLVKRTSDALLSLGLAVVVVPVIMVVSLLVWLEDRGPVFFRQERVGVRGTTFRMYKFRSMVVNADQHLAELRASADLVNERLFKDAHDPRITRIGRVLRRYSLDELPQLINVVRGEMSLVGPRPPLASEVATYEQDEVQRLRVRPGLTGLWQISGRSDLTWEQSLRLDLWYVDNWTPLLDLQILVRTARAVVGGAGAY